MSGTPTQVLNPFLIYLPSKSEKQKGIREREMERENMKEEEGVWSQLLPWIHMQNG